MTIYICKNCHSLDNLFYKLPLEYEVCGNCMKAEFEIYAPESEKIKTIGTARENAELFAADSGASPGSQLHFYITRSFILGIKWWVENRMEIDLQDFHDYDEGFCTDTYKKIKLKVLESL